MQYLKLLRPSAQFASENHSVSEIVSISVFRWAQYEEILIVLGIITAPLSPWNSFYPFHLETESLSFVNKDIGDGQG
jgi:hypothetical protein